MKKKAPNLCTFKIYTSMSQLPVFPFLLSPFLKFIIIMIMIIIILIILIIIIIIMCSASTHR